MMKRILVGFVALVLLFVAVIYVSIRLRQFKPGFPDNVILAPKAGENDWQGVDSVLLKATDMYVTSPYHEVIMGENYRSVWDAPVKVPVVWLDTLFGGLTPVEAGGGGQTRSLELASPSGRIYTLRTVCKDPSGIIPSAGRWFKLHNLMIDAMSAGHPYAALPVAKLSEAAGLQHSHPWMIFVPQQPALDTFNNQFANRLFFLEIEPEGKTGDWTGYENVVKLEKSDDVKDKILESPLHRADQSMMLRARLLDILIGDWDRHKRNWGWIVHQKDSLVLYTPFPVDRDMAFYGISGLVPWIINRPGVADKFRPYHEKIDYLKGLLHSGRFVDPFFLNEMTHDDFMKTAAELQKLISNEQIELAFRTWPDTVFQLGGAEIVSSMKTRRADLPEYAEAYYRHLAKEVQVMGTVGNDSFLIKQTGDKHTLVEVYSPTKQGHLVRKYRRIFNAAETKAITLFGWEGNDAFRVEGQLPIEFVMVGGKGLDRFTQSPAEMNNSSKISLYDKPGDMKAPDGYKVIDKDVKAKMPIKEKKKR